MLPNQYSARKHQESSTLWLAAKAVVIILYTGYMIWFITRPIPDYKADTGSTRSHAQQILKDL
jgi:hypothetical protein